MGDIEGWARKWLENQRHEGKTCLEIKTRGSKNYVYHSTNRYDKETRKQPSGANQLLAMAKPWVVPIR
jgi:hypothetical protein